ncbi:MAG: prolyl oligopeptidase family serine peptidase [Planctomycetaceae bacterium]|nr:prolyl oligopeptidase family serine peptidase [Planctomycetaceae bacterium]
MLSRVITLGGLVLAALMPTISIAADPDHRDRFTSAIFEDTSGHKLPYRLLAPAKVGAGTRYPLVVFLHGAGERGDDNKKQLVHGMNDFASDEIMAKYPAFVVAPQCPEGKRWVEVDWTLDSHQMPAQPSEPLTDVFELIDNLVATKPIDAKRIYITGLSMGGFGVWDAVQRRPELFAAAAPICGGGDPLLAKQIHFVPVWAFHGDDDKTVKVKRSREMIEALRDVGERPKYTEYKGVDHDSWTRTYKDPALYEWLFAQRKK